MFVPGKPFQPSLVFVGKARAYLSEAPFKWSTLGKAPGLTRKHLTRLERLARDKCCSFLRKVITSGRKKFYNIGRRSRRWSSGSRRRRWRRTWSSGWSWSTSPNRGQCYKTFYGCKLPIFVVFAPGKSFQPSLMFAGKAILKHLSGSPFYGRLLASPTNIWLGWKGLPGTYALAYYEKL